MKEKSNILYELFFRTHYLSVQIRIFLTFLIIFRRYLEKFINKKNYKDLFGYLYLCQIISIVSILYTDIDYNKPNFNISKLLFTQIIYKLFLIYYTLIIMKIKLNVNYIIGSIIILIIYNYLFNVENIYNLEKNKSIKIIIISILIGFLMNYLF